MKKIKMSKADQAMMDKAFAEDAKRRRTEDKAFGERRIQAIHKIQHAGSDLIQLLFHKSEGARVTVTVAVEMKNGAKLGWTTCSVEMPDTIKQKIKKALGDSRKRRAKLK